MSKKLGVFSNFFSKAFSVFTPQTSVRCEELLLSWMESWRAAAKGATRVVKSGFYIAAFSPGNFAAILLSNPVTASDLSNSSFYLPSGRLFDIHCCSRFIYFFGFYDQVYLVSFASKSHLFIYSVYIFESSFLLFTSFGIALEPYPGSWRRTTVAFSGLAKKKAVLKGTYTLAMRPI